MEIRIIVLHFLLGVLTLSVGAPSDGIESSTSTSVSVSTVTRKVTSRSFSKSYQLPNDTQTATEVVLKTQDRGKQEGEESDVVTKPQKIKKKILASNLKNISEKVVFPGDKHEKILIKPIANVTEAVDGGKPYSSDSSEDEMPLIEEVPLKFENITEITKNKTLYEQMKKNGGPIEGRSLEDRSSEENINVNTKEKTRIPLVTTLRTTSSYSYDTFNNLQKVLNSNYLNNEGYERGSGSRGARPSSVILPAKSSSSISKDNSFKNAIRFESEYYGPTGQTDWVPIVPDKLPVRPTNGGQHFGAKMKPAVVEKSNKTNEKNNIVFPSEAVQPVKVSSTTSARETEFEKVTPRVQTTVQTRISTSTETEQISGTHPVRPTTKFRGAVKFKTNQSNSTINEQKFQKEIVSKKNISLEIPAMEIPVTGATWTLATLGGAEKSAVKSTREETTEISVVSSTNHTTKSQNAVEGGLAVPPENVKVENVTKEPLTKNIISGTLDDLKHNKSEITNSLPKVVDGGQGWIPLKMEKEIETKNNTDLVLPESVLLNQRNESVIETVKPVTPEMDLTSGDVTTEEMMVTESTPDFTTLPELWKVTTEMPVTSEASSQSGKDEFAETTTIFMINEKSDAEEVPMTTNVSATQTSESTTRPTSKPLATDYTDAQDNKTLTEISPATFTVNTNLVQNYNSSEGQLEDVVISTLSGKDVEKSASTPATPLQIPPVFTTSTASTGAVTIPKLIPIENITKTTIPMEITYPTPNLTETTTAILTTMGTIPPTKTSTLSTVTTSPSTTTSTTTSTSQTQSTTIILSTTRGRDDESNIVGTEAGIYYKNYIPTTMNPHVEITEESVPAYLRLTVQAKGWDELCKLKEDLREAIINMLGGKRNVSAESVHFLNLNDRTCQEKIEETKGDRNGTIFLPVNMFLMDKGGDFDKNLSEAFLTLWGRRGLDFELPIRKVDFVTPIVNLTELADPPLGGSVVAAIVISCVAGICVILLGVLFVIMKRRQKRFNYGQRCTPVSLDAYSLDSVSIYNSVRRKGVRASKRSYGNAAFDDPETSTHPMNFAGLANFSSDKEQLYEEFNIIPQVYPKVEELPAGTETKNRYANIIPLPETRVHLSLKDGDPLSDYINANYVRGLRGAEKTYIACQAPMESTVEDFWRMVWEQQCRVILMLTDLQENGIEKCTDYLPPNEVTDNLRLFGDFQVTLKKRDVKEKYIISNLKLKNMEANLWREVTHLWYLGWPDQGVPSEANSLIAFLIEARSQMKIQNGATTSSPVIVHCSPGTGRTGTVIACDICIREYEQTRMVDIPRCVFNLRRDRAGAVQTKDQYAFIYQVLNVYATKLSGGGIESI